MRVFSLIATSCLVLSSLFGQEQNFFPSGLGAEVGGGHNQLFQKDIVAEVDRKEFSLTPTIRVDYRFGINDQVKLMFFLGYDRFGGRQSLPNGYQDQYWFDAIDAGTIISYSFSPVSIGMGLRANRHLRVIGRFHGFYNALSNDGTDWLVYDVSSLFKKWSLDLGMRSAISISSFSFALEAWLGLSNLNRYVEMRQNSFRFLVGYYL